MINSLNFNIDIYLARATLAFQPPLERCGLWLGKVQNNYLQFLDSLGKDTTLL
jgi:hypothetical protein